MKKAMFDVVHEWVNECINMFRIPRSKCECEGEYQTIVPNERERERKNPFIAPP